MLEFYNSLAMYSYNQFIHDNNYTNNFIAISAALAFVIIFISMRYFETEHTYSFSQIFGVSSFFLIIGGGVGAILSAFWSLIVFYLLPFVFISYIIFKSKDIINFISNKINNHKNKSNTKLKNIVNDIKADEIAQQAYETLKKDFPSIKYETVLKHVKGKM